MKFTADTAEFQTNIKAAGKTVKQMEESVREAKQRILQSYKEQMEAARKVGASDQEFADIRKRVQQMLAAAVDESSTRIGRSLADTSERNRKAAQAWERENQRIIESEQAKARALEVSALKADILARSGPASESGSGHKVSGQTAASGAVQLLDGRGGIRTIENFASTTLGLGGVFGALFPVVGAIQSAKLLAEMGEHIYEVREKALQAGAAFRESFGEMHAANLTVLADLNLQAAKLQLNIDKLSGHPGNGLAVALAESAKQTDAFIDKLRQALKLEDAVFKAHSVGVFGGLLSGQSGTGKQEKNLTRDAKDFEGRVNGFNDEFNSAAGGAKSPAELKALDEKRNQQIIDAFGKQIDTYRRERKRLVDVQKESQQPTGFSAYGAPIFAPAIDNGAKIAELDGVTKQYEDKLNVFKAGLNVARLTEQENALRGQKEAGKLASEAQRKNLEEQRKAAEEQRKVWDESYKDFNESGNKTLDQQERFWEDLRNSVVMGSENWRVADEHVADLIHKINAEKQKAFGEGLKMQREWNDAGLKSQSAQMQEWIKGQMDALTARQALEDVQRNTGYQVAEASVQYDVAAGRLSRYDATVQLQTLHTERYQDALASLQRKLAQVVGGPEADAQKLGIQQQIAQLDGRRAIEVMQDNAEQAAATWQGALGNALGNWVQQAQDSASQVRDIVTSALNGLNSNAVDAAIGGKTNFAGLVEGTGKQMLSFGLQRLEAPLLGKLGIGKPDGTPSNPMNVHVLNMGEMGGVGQTAANALGSIVPSSSIGSAATGVLQTALGFVPGGSVIGGLVGAMFGGHRALGGKVQAGMTYDVGEMGRESFTPATDGYITPADKMGSGTAYYTIHTNEGVTSEQVHQQVQAALREAHPRVVRDSINGVRDAQARRSNMR